MSLAISLRIPLVIAVAEFPLQKKRSSIGMKQNDVII